MKIKTLRFSLLIGVICLLLSSCTDIVEPPTPAPVLQDSAQIPTLLLDEKKMTTDPAPILHDGKLFLPLVETLALLKIQSSIYPDSHVITACHDNRFISVNTETLTISRNGKKLQKTMAPILINETLFVPSTLIFDTFDLSIAYPKDGIIAITQNNSAESPQLVNGEYYVPIVVKEADLQFYVPKSWNRLPNAPFRFGEDNDYESYYVDFSIVPANNHTDAQILINQSAAFQENETITLQRDQITALHINGLEGHTATYRYFKNDLPGKLLMFIFQRDDNAYLFSCSVEKSIDEAVILQQMTNIARSLRLGDMLVDVQKEHYFEAPAFYEKGIQLTSPLYGNMDVKGKLIFNGTVEERDVKWLYASITREGETITQRFSVKDRSFSAIVNLPFSLGKHDLTFYASSGEPRPQDRVLQVSVVNTEQQKTRWIVPSTIVDSDSEYISSQSSLLTYKTYGDYLKARQIFKWVIETATPGKALGDPASASTVYLKSRGSELEISILYTAMLRAAEIPSRITIDKGDDAKVWTEMQINGQWVASDPVAAIQRIRDGAPLEEAIEAHFNMSRAYFEERYKLVETMEW